MEHHINQFGFDVIVFLQHFPWEPVHSNGFIEIAVSYCSLYVFFVEYSFCNNCPTICFILGFVLWLIFLIQHSGNGLFVICYSLFASLVRFSNKDALQKFLVLLHPCHSIQFWIEFLHFVLFVISLQCQHIPLSFVQLGRLIFNVFGLPILVQVVMFRLTIPVLFSLSCNLSLYQLSSIFLDYKVPETYHCLCLIYPFTNQALISCQFVNLSIIDFANQFLISYHFLINQLGFFINIPIDKFSFNLHSQH